MVRNYDNTQVPKYNTVSKKPFDSLSGPESHLKVRKQSIPSAHREASFYFDQRRQLIGGSDLQYIKNHIFFFYNGRSLLQSLSQLQVVP